MNQPVIFILCAFVVDFLFPKSMSQYSYNHEATTWILSELARDSSKKVSVTGHPKMIACQYGNALLFNGISDGLFLDSMPLHDLQKFTIEAIIRPDAGGNTEQRFFHCGEIKGDRVLMEMRTTLTDWYFDAFIKSSDHMKVMMDSCLLHRLNQWYHIAFVVDHGKMITYVNRIKELEDHMNLVPLRSGKSSIGVRLNELSWFKGAIYKIKISHDALKPSEFMND